METVVFDERQYRRAEAFLVRVFRGHDGFRRFLREGHRAILKSYRGSNECERHEQSRDAGSEKVKHRSSEVRSVGGSILEL